MSRLDLFIGFQFIDSKKKSNEDLRIIRKICNPKKICPKGLLEQRFLNQVLTKLC